MGHLLVCHPLRILVYAERCFPHQTNITFTESPGHGGVRWVHRVFFLGGGGYGTLSLLRISGTRLLLSRGNQKA